MEYEKKSLVELKAIAKEKGLKKISTLKKQELIDVLKEFDKQSEKTADITPKKARAAKSEKTSETKTSETKTLEKTSETKSSESKPEKQTKAVSKPDQPQVSDNRDGYQNRRTFNYNSNMSQQTQHTQSQQSQQQTQHSQGQQSQQQQTQHSQGQQPQQQQTQHSQGQQPQQQQTQHAQGQQPQQQQHPQGQPSGASQPNQMDSGEIKSGILEVMADGFGFVRCDNFLPGEQDVYVSPALIRRFGLRTGDYIVGNTRVKTQGEKFSALLFVKTVNGYPPSVLSSRKKFEDLTPIFPNQRIHLETSGSGTAMRMVDIISPIGKGQRGMIVSQPKAGKTTLLKQIAKAVNANHPEMHLIILLVDERPEEVTEFKESIEGNDVDVIYSTFDELPENHRRVSEMVIERAKRLVEHGRDVMILLDSITRLARAYNLTVQPSGRTLSGGLDPAALYMPKRFFGAARNMREGGSLTILATALVDTGSRMDDVVFEEFKGTGNMELVLDRSLSEKRIFPAIDLPKSSTRRDDLLLSRDEMEASFLMRRAMNGMRSEEAVENIINMFVRTKNNREFVDMIKKVKII